jgi:hypothetical protein
MSWAQGVASVLPQPQADTRESFAQAVNGSGFVVGRSSDGSQQVATLWYQGRAIDLNALRSNRRQDADAWSLDSANDINDSGVIVGRAVRRDGSGMSPAFVLTSVPEPAIWVMLLAGVALLGARTGRAEEAITLPWPRSMGAVHVATSKTGQARKPRSREVEKSAGAMTSR